jgi:hypothetical protein
VHARPPRRRQRPGRRGTEPRQVQLEQPDGFPTIGYRHGQQRALAGLAHIDPLRAQHPLVHGAGQLHRLGVLRAVESTGGHARCEFTETNDPVAAEIGDQKTHRAGSDHDSQLVRDHLDRVDGRGGFDLLQKSPQICPRTWMIHAMILTLALARPGRVGARQHERSRNVRAVAVARSSPLRS